MAATTVRHVNVAAAGVALHCAVMGDARSGRPPLILLHGFPDHWAGWHHVMEAFAHERLVLAPDGRGINLSDKPPSVEAYALAHLVADVEAVATHFAADGQVDLAGHDWGGVVAWSMAALHPERIRRLVILNAPHPAVVSAELARSPLLRKALSYVKLLRAPDAEARLSAEGFARLKTVYAELRAAGRWSVSDDARAIAAWSRPGALTAALNWYRAADFLLPHGRAPIKATRLAMPALLLWGKDDMALLPDLALAHAGLAAPLTIDIVEACGHWPQHQQPALVVERMRRFLA